MKDVWYLECVNLFNILCPHKFKKFKDSHSFLNYNKNDFVYFNEDSSKAIYLITSGKIKLGYYTKDGDEIVKAILKKGEVFGEKAFLGEEKRNEFAQSLDSKTEVCPINVDTLHELVRDNANFSISFYKFLNFRFKKLERQLEILMFKDVRRRVLEFIEELRQSYGKILLDGTTQIRHPFSQKDMASLIGSSRPSLNIVLNKLKDEGYLSFQGKEIILKKAKVLDS